MMGKMLRSAVLALVCSVVQVGIIQPWVATAQGTTPWVDVPGTGIIRLGNATLRLRAAGGMGKNYPLVGSGWIASGNGVQVRDIRDLIALMVSESGLERLRNVDDTMEARKARRVVGKQLMLMWAMQRSPYNLGKGTRERVEQIKDCLTRTGNFTRADRLGIIANRQRIHTEKGIVEDIFFNNPQIFPTTSAMSADGRFFTIRYKCWYATGRYWYQMTFSLIPNANDNSGSWGITIHFDVVNA